MMLTPLLRPLLAALALSLPALAGAADFDLDALMQRLARVDAGQARFTEERHIAQIDQVLRSSGRLAFAAPDRFVRETLQPRRERLAVEGNQLTMTQGGRSRTLALDSAPEAAVIVEAIRGTLTGDRGALQRWFEARVQGSPAQWQLSLVPREAQLRGEVKQILISGREGQLREVRMQLAGGDDSVMRIEPMEPAATGAPRP